MAKTTFPSELKAAGQAIRNGKLVAFPTETVYGLGANALDAEAVARIFAAKGRPASSPLIVHVLTVEQARELVSEWPERAHLLAEKFWPGPLTLVLPKSEKVPDRVSGGLNTVGVRIPSNNMARLLIREAGVPIAAPSANRFTELSPTTADHVRQSLGAAVDIILDDGPCSVGIESTVIALADDRAELLRPGMITRPQIEEVIGPVSTPRDADHRSPGQHPQHYRPRTSLLVTEQPPPTGVGMCLTRNEMPADPRAFAAELYRKLHELDRLNFDWIAIAPVPDGPEWDAIRDRLERARTRRSVTTP